MDTIIIALQVVFFILFFVVLVALVWLFAIKAKEYFVHLRMRSTLIKFKNQARKHAEEEVQKAPHMKNDLRRAYVTKKLMEHFEECSDMYHKEMRVTAEHRMLFDLIDSHDESPLSIEAKTRAFALYVFDNDLESPDPMESNPHAILPEIYQRIQGVTTIADD